MTIHNLNAYVDNLWDWAFLNECFDFNIRVSDVDGIVERCGHCLLLEAKSPGKQIPIGQRRMFETLAKDGWAVLVLWGTPSTPEEMQIWYPFAARPQSKQLTSAEQIKCLVRGWFVWASSPCEGILFKHAVRRASTQ
jgi:hypothetical protein